ncbi:hypothetical protein [Deinococcus multiflagellatus]|uniref:Uncharacterized protein n=1 Tax=Deinococcus multiflagellatus TaxID=1656887 RepID=A0ABW1ZQH6_9DEIO|nr:hypothetical protein [Deinococcus multiflagellatus]MBZ9715847.1 hypothetical protein [Deinococcus multiflagellatus]
MAGFVMIQVRRSASPPPASWTEASPDLVVSPEEATFLLRTLQLTSLAVLTVGGTPLTVFQEGQWAGGQPQVTVYLDRGLDAHLQVPLLSLLMELTAQLETCGPVPEQSPTLPLHYGYALMARRHVGTVELLTEELSVAAQVQRRDLSLLVQAQTSAVTTLLSDGSTLRSWPAAGRFVIAPLRGLRLELNAAGYASLLAYLPQVLAESVAR